MADFIVGTNELENIGTSAANDPRTKDQICTEMGVDPDALRLEARAYAKVAQGNGAKQAAKAILGVEPTDTDIIASALAVGFELGYRARQVVEGVE